MLKAARGETTVIGPSPSREVRTDWLHRALPELIAAALPSGPQFVAHTVPDRR